MKDTSDRFDPTSSHKLAVKVAPPDDPGNALPLAGGSVTLDRQATSMGRCDLTFNSEELVPNDHEALLAPFGQELQVWRGIEYGPGDQELLSLGIFRIYEASIDDEGEGITIQVSGLDRSSRIIDAAFEQPYQISSGSDFVTAMQTTIQEAYPGVVFDFASFTGTLPLITAAEGEDRWQFVQDMAAAIGMELYFNGEGVLVMAQVPAATTGVAAHGLHLHEGGTEEPAVLLSARKGWSRDDVANRWIVTGENSDDGTPPPRAVATDSNPLSPTYYDGDFGKVPKFVTSEFITDATQAQAAADGYLNLNLGIAQAIDFGIIVNPAIEPGDGAHIMREQLGLDEVHIVDSVTIPLSATESMSGATRTAQVTS